MTNQPPVADDRADTTDAKGPVCITCSRNLQDVPPGGTCPECGTPVINSHQGILLQTAPSDYRDQLLRGVSLVLNGILLMIILVSTLLLIGLGARSLGHVLPPLYNLGSVFVILIPSFMMLLGYFIYALPDPNFVSVEEPSSARRIVRNAVVAIAGLTLLSTIIDVLETSFGSSGILKGLSIAASIMSISAWIVQFLAVMHYTRWIARRIPDQKIIKNATTYMWLLPVIYIVGILLLGLGPIIALVLYWNLLNRVRTHLKSINSTGLPAELPGR